MMSKRIDAELNRIDALGETPIAIHVGPNTYLDELAFSRPIMAGLAPDDGSIALQPSVRVRDYKGIPVIEHDQDADPDYLKVESVLRTTDEVPTT